MITKPKNTDNIIFKITNGKYLGQLVKEGRRKFNLSFAQFAFMSSMSKHQLTKLESGKTDVLLNRELHSMGYFIKNQ